MFWECRAQQTQGSQLRGNIVHVLSDWLTFVDVSMVHPVAPTYIWTTLVEGGVAAVWVHAARALYEFADRRGYTVALWLQMIVGCLSKLEAQ